MVVLSLFGREVGRLSLRAAGFALRAVRMAVSSLTEREDWRLGLMLGALKLGALKLGALMLGALMLGALRLGPRLWGRLWELCRFLDSRY